MEFITITNDVQLAKYFEESGINSIMIDLEIIGKRERQKGLNTVISNHSVEDVSSIKMSLKDAACLVRINPIHNGSKDEIAKVIDNGADIVMLPMFKTIEEVSFFVNAIGSKAKKYLLLETSQALARIDDISSIDGIDAVHIGLNDLSISLGLDFLYEPLIDGLVEYLTSKLRLRGIRFGIGGASRLEKSKLIFSEHVRLGSDMVIINRDFKLNSETYQDVIQRVDMKREIESIVDYLVSLQDVSVAVLEENRLSLISEIKCQINKMKKIDA